LRHLGPGITAGKQALPVRHKFFNRNRREKHLVIHHLFPVLDRVPFQSPFGDAELWQGIFNLTTGGKRRGPLTAFVNEPPDTMRVLGLDQRAARKWGEITRRGLDPLPVRDSLIAVIALSRNLTVVTRDWGPIKRAGCQTLNPFAS